MKLLNISNCFHPHKETSVLSDGPLSLYTFGAISLKFSVQPKILYITEDVKMASTRF